MYMSITQEDQGQGQTHLHETISEKQNNNKFNKRGRRDDATLDIEPPVGQPCY